MYLKEIVNEAENSIILAWDWVPSVLYNGYRGLFPPGGKAAEGVKLAIHLNRIPKSRMGELYLRCLIN
jgi:hypothetical protein